MSCPTPDGATVAERAAIYAQAIMQRDRTIAALVAALRALLDPQNFRTDPTLATLRHRDRAIDEACAALAKVDV